MELREVLVGGDVGVVDRQRPLIASLCLREVTRHVVGVAQLEAFFAEGLVQLRRRCDLRAEQKHPEGGGEARPPVADLLPEEVGVLSLGRVGLSGRSTEGFRITKDSRNGIYKARFRHRGKRFHLSTGTRDRKDAGVVAARIYAEALSSNRRPTERIVGRPLDAVAANWLDAIAPPVVSEDTWKHDLELRPKKLIPHVRHTELATEVGVEDYITTRLRSVRRPSVKKELGSLRRFVTWAVKRGELASFQFPKVPKQAKRARQLNRPLIELSREQAEAVIRALPVRTQNGHHPRVLFTVFRETGLRLRGVQRSPT